MNKQAYRAWITARRNVDPGEHFEEAVMQAISVEAPRRKPTSLPRWAMAALWLIAAAGFLYQITSVLTFLMLFQTQAH